MKKIFLLAILIAGIAIVSCSKDDLGADPIIPPPPPPPVVELAPTVELTVSSASILYSTDVTVTWTSTNATKVSINGESMTSVNGSKTYSNLITTTKYTALATNVIKTASDEKTVTVEEEPTPTAELTISPNDAVLPYGKDITVTWNITNFKTATLNGEAITEATGSKEFKQLLKDSIFTIVATNFTKSVTTTKTVVVGDWKSSVFGKISHGYWNKISYTVYTPEEDIIYMIDYVNDSDGGVLKWYFYLDFTYSIFNADNTPWSTGTSNWGLDSDPTHFILGTVYTIKELTLDRFVISKVENWLDTGLPVRKETVYIR
ncbi:MAG: hypothetical protein JJE53_02495 [Candidatus Pacebacteria bacterium]|nr:hypothetical protein [Candidatus Paceibacterota bacterium]